jgi:hypothetical protein
MRCLWHDGQRDSQHEEGGVDMFRSEGHKTRFVEEIQRIGKIYDGKLDEEYSAALYLLTGSLNTWSKVKSHVDRDGINFEDLLEAVDLSGGESVLVRWAGSLFGQPIHIDPIELMRLDEHNFKLAIQALRLRRNPVRMDEID